MTAMGTLALHDVAAEPSLKQGVVGFSREGQMYFPIEPKRRRSIPKGLWIAISYAFILLYLIMTIW